MQFNNVSSATIVSGFKYKTYSPFVTCNALLFAFAKPSFKSFFINFTSGNFGCRYSIELSGEALSITIISASIFLHAASTECRHCSKKYFTLKLTIIIESFMYYKLCKYYYG